MTNRNTVFLITIYPQQQKWKTTVPVQLVARRTSSDISWVQYVAVNNVTSCRYNLSKNHIIIVHPAPQTVKTCHDHYVRVCVPLKASEIANGFSCNIIALKLINKIGLCTF